MMALRAQWHVIRALVVRDLIIRYGRNNIGFIWTILEPMLLCAGVTLFWALAKPPYMHNVEVITFVVTGYMPLTLYRHMTNPCVHILKINQTILVHRQISLMDVFLSRCILEFAGTTLAFLTVYGFLLLIRATEFVYDYKLILMGWLLLAWFGMGIGALIAAATEAFEGAHHFVGPVQYLSIPLSPTFYMVDWMPTAVQDLLWYNPLTHPYEMIRAGFFGPNVIAHYDPKVTFFYGLFYVAFGLWAIEAVKEKLHDH